MDSNTTIQRDEPALQERRRRAATLAAAALLVAMLTLGAGTSVAGAMIIGGHGATGVPGSTYAAAYCKRGSITVAPQASVQLGFTNGQYISYRYHVASNRGHRSTSGWSGAQLVLFNNYRWGLLPSSTIAAALNTVWSVQVQYAYWRVQNGQWAVSYSNWQPATYLVSSGSGSYTTNACHT